MLRADTLDVYPVSSFPVLSLPAKPACDAQALICVALGLPPTFFRRLVQSNGATSVLDFMPPRGGGAPTLVVDRLNQVRTCTMNPKASVHFSPRVGRGVG